jgi:hypothetical protein
MKNNYYDKQYVEQCRGKQLPPYAVIHHHEDELVVCQDQSYHMVLHQRMTAKYECKIPYYRKCNFCGLYDEPSALKFGTKRGVYHLDCRQNVNAKGETNG